MRPHAPRGGQEAPDLEQQSIAAQQPRGIRPTGTMNGMAAGQFQTTMGGMFRTQNGEASSTYDTGKYFEPRQI